LTKGNLGRHKNSIPVPLHLSQLLLLLKLPAQLPFGRSEVFFGLLHLSVAGSNGLLQRLRVLQPSLDQLVLKFSGFIPLGSQLVLVLEG
jgi:hypothetical protein